MPSLSASSAPGGPRQALGGTGTAPEHAAPARNASSAADNPRPGEPEPDLPNAGWSKADELPDIVACFCVPELRYHLVRALHKRSALYTGTRNSLFDGNCAPVSFSAPKCRQPRPAYEEPEVNPDHQDDAHGYRVELWRQNKEGIERLLAVTTTASVGYAAFYAAAREYRDRCITLRRGDRILSTWPATPILRG